MYDARALLWEGLEVEYASRAVGRGALPFESSITPYSPPNRQPVLGQGTPVQFWQRQFARTGGQPLPWGARHARHRQALCRLRHKNQHNCMESLAGSPL